MEQPEVNSKIWVFPACENVRIACHAAMGVQVAYAAALLRMQTCGTPYQCSLAMGVLDGQPVLILQWEPGVDERLLAIVDAIALLAGGTAHSSSPSEGAL
jgi:hypothetical protein